MLFIVSPFFWEFFMIKNRAASLFIILLIYILASVFALGFEEYKKQTRML